MAAPAAAAASQARRGIWVVSLPPLFTNQNHTTTNDYGLFTTQRFSFTDSDHLEVGARYSKVDILNRTTDLERSYDAITGNASFRHEFSDNLTAYISGGTSFRPGSGGANNPPTPVIPASFGNFEDEKSRSIELGLKGQWFDGGLVLMVD